MNNLDLKHGGYSRLLCLWVGLFIGDTLNCLVQKGFQKNKKNWYPNLGGLKSFRRKEY
jgi:hypothetical protein